MGWDLLQVTQSGGERGPAGEVREARHTWSSVVSIWCSLIQRLSPSSLYAYPFSLVVPCQQLSVVPVFHLSLAFMALLLMTYWLALKG